jgi:hypothetical protein
MTAIQLVVKDVHPRLAIPADTGMYGYIQIIYQGKSRSEAAGRRRQKPQFLFLSYVLGALLLPDITLTPG